MTPDLDVHKLYVGQILRDRVPRKVTPPLIDGLVNLYAATAYPTGKLIPFGAGINRIAAVSAPDGPRHAAILISSSPHKSGSAVTPWQDFFAPDEGYVRYFGDAKTPGQSAHAAPGNAILLGQLEQFQGQTTPGLRRKAVPLIFFRREPGNPAPKGYPRFQGFGVITGARLVSQFSDAHGQAFSNYEFTCAVLTLKHEGEEFDWRWINARRTSSLTDKEASDLAPASWKEWVSHGEPALERLRRKVLRRTLTPVSDQIPAEGSPDEQLLSKIYAHYPSGKKVYFEGLAAAVAERVLAASGSVYTNHGITRGSGDFGIDFIAQLNVGEGFSRTALVVLGQAKCIKPGSQTNAVDLARTVARLRRGWLGVFVTTGAISKRAQQEVYEDRYPLVLIPGRRVAEVVRQMLNEEGHQNVEKLLTGFDSLYELSPRVSDPERLVV